MKIDLHRSGLENLLTLVLVNNPKFRGTVLDTTASVARIVNHPSQCNTVAELTATGDGVYDALSPMVVHYNRRPLNEFIDTTSVIHLPSTTSSYDIVDAVMGAMVVQDPKIRSLVKGTLIMDTDEPYKGRVYLEVVEDFYPCLHSPVEVPYEIDRPAPVARILADDLDVTDLNGFI